MRVSQIAAVCAVLGACRSDRAPAPPGAAAGKDDRVAAARRLAGCYILQTAQPPSYRLELGMGGEAHRIEPGATPNAALDRWEWSARTDSTFVVSWSGIDSWMEFNVARRDGQWIADGVIRTVSGEEPLPTKVERVGCPPPGA